MGAKKRESIEIPLHLARLLATEKEDMKDPEKYEDVQALSRACLRLLLTGQGE